ncbi:hypothetical protein A2U01_0063856, partial [Trifolium medium]|nr:hypothetical protein [Trifolium medium]
MSICIRQSGSPRDFPVWSSENRDFFPWGWGWRQKFPRGHFGAGIGDEASVPADSP